VRLLTAKTTTSSTTSGVAGTATPRPTPTPTFAPLPTVLPAGQGWAKTTGPDYAAAVAVAPGQPATLYTCSSDLDPHPRLGLSHDGGRTWQTSTLPASCDALEVSPANAQDLAFSGEKCQLSSAAAATSAGKFGFRAPRGEDVVVGPIPPVPRISAGRADYILPGVSGGRQDGCATISIKSWAYVSADGGKHWTQANLPPNAIDAPEFVGYLIAWVGTTLFVAPNYINLPPDVHTLAASTNGGPFVWVDQNGLSGRVPVGMTLSNLTSLGDTLFVTYDGLVCSSQLSPPCATAATTSDGGATWSRIRPIYQGEDLQIIGGAAGALLALPRNVNSPTRALLRSTDGGATWTALPVLPGGVRPSPTTTFALPDGTTIAQVDFLIPQGGSPSIHL